MRNVESITWAEFPEGLNVILNSNVLKASPIFREQQGLYFHSGVHLLAYLARVVLSPIINTRK